jgi:hypothetical protein
MHQKNMVFGYRNAFGVTTLEFYRLYYLNDVILEKLFHLTNNTPISKFDLVPVFQYLKGYYNLMKRLCRK